MGTNMYAYCLNDPVNYWDPSGTKSIAFGFRYDLTTGWYARFDYGETGNLDHVHIWNATEKYAYNIVDGSLSHDNKDNAGKDGTPPSWVMKKLKKLSGFDLDKTRSEYLKNQDNICTKTVLSTYYDKGFKSYVEKTEWKYDGTVQIIHVITGQGYAPLPFPGMVPVPINPPIPFKIPPIKLPQFQFNFNWMFPPVSPSPLLT